MASSNTTKPSQFKRTTDTALCLIPPKHLWERIDDLRSRWDMEYEEWPPHINIMYPFAQPEDLEQVVELIRPALDLSHVAADTSSICLDEVGVLPKRLPSEKSNILYLRPSKGSNADLKINRIRKLVGTVMGIPDPLDFPYMTIGCSLGVGLFSHNFLLAQLRKMVPIEWDSIQLAVLVRGNANTGNLAGKIESLKLDAMSRDLKRIESLRRLDRRSNIRGEMSLWGYIEPRKVSRVSGEPLPLYETANDELVRTTASPQPAYKFLDSDGVWERHWEQHEQRSGTTLDRLIVASYNVLAECDWTPSSERHSGLVRTILSRRAVADILVLQEVTDQFLNCLLADPEVQQRYPYSTRVPPNEAEVGSLSSTSNVVVLSKYDLRWSQLKSIKKEKGAIVATFPTLTSCSASDGQPLVLVACHLSQGLVDGVVNAKRAEVQGLLKYLSTRFENHPWIIAGDFNLATSVDSLDMARKSEDLSPRSYKYLRDFDSMLADNGLQDAWVVSKVLSGESSEPGAKARTFQELQEGEQGATFDPLVNTIAAEIVGSGLNNRPQRYDRILVSHHSRLRPRRFNMFGTPSATGGADHRQEVFSDHWGIRCLLEMTKTRIEDSNVLSDPIIHSRRGMHTFGGLEEFKKDLNLRAVLPSKEDVQRRQNAIWLLERVLQCESGDQSRETAPKGPRMFLAPVGSFALGCWTASSDVDCLCLGEISSSTFFSLAVQRLRKAQFEGISILRRVRASSGTMLELSILGIRFDLQYCCAPMILKDYPDILRRPFTDPVFALPPSMLAKLKALRDLSYLRLSIPDRTQYNIAHVYLSTWAKSRGLYGAKFGLLSSVHISVLLVPICKTLAVEHGTVSVGDIIATFFYHYSRFDWKSNAVFDPFFHESLKYHRTFREPLCLLGWHGPSLNTTASASTPTVKMLTEELCRADEIIGSELKEFDSILEPIGANESRVDCISSGVRDFLHGFKSYIKISAHYWGSSSTAGAQFVGWLESRCVMLLVDLDRKVPSLAARIWPQRFTAAPKSDTDFQEPDPGPSCHGCYLIGLAWQAGSSEEEDARLAEESLQTVLRQFENRIRTDKRYLDSATCWMSAEVVPMGQVYRLSIDDYHPGDSLGANGMSEDEELSEDGEDEEDEEAEPSKQSNTTDNVSVPGKFRTARDVMNRIKWDPALDSSDYIIGYEDRFVGTREKQLELWKSEQTDEEFIPQHRILYFKRRGDDVIVWDRKSRIDDMFGSGVVRE